MARAPGWHHDLSPASRWVLAHGLATGHRPPPGVLDDATWQQLRAESTTHRLDGLLVDAVATDALGVTARQADEVAELEIDLTRARLWQERRLVEVVDLIESAGVEVRVLKGLAVATLDYPDAQLRPTGDVDLLVHGDDLGRAGHAIEATGGARTDPDPVPGLCQRVTKGATYAADEGEIDLHRLLVWGPLGVRLDPDLLWQTERRFTVDGRALRTLSAHDTLLHACSHLLVLGSRRALELRDVAQLATRPALDVEGLLVRARQWGAEGLLASAVMMTVAELDLPQLGAHELGRWAAGYPVTTRDRLWLRVERPDQPVPGLEAVATLIELPSRQARWELIRATLRPAPGTWASPGRRARSLGRKLVRTSQIAESLTNRSARTDLMGRTPHSWP